MKIRKLPSGSYNAQIYLGIIDGKKKWKSVTGKSRMEVRRMVEEFHYHAERPQAPMLCDAIDRYISSRKAVISPYTERGYRNILSALKRMPEAQISSDADVLAFQTIINKLQLDGKSPKTIANYIGLIAPAVRSTGNTFAALTKPQAVKPDLYLPTEDIMKKVLEAARGTELEIPIELGMLGLRRGEVCAVEAKDIEKDILHVRRAAVQIGSSISSKPPKTYESDRYVLLPPSLSRKIKKNGRATDLKPSMLSDRFAALLKKNHIRHFRFHDLRAFFASYCHNTLHLSDAQIQALGGWRTSHVMRRAYIRPMQEDDAARSAARSLGALMR